jgi:hypothetical protein
MASGKWQVASSKIGRLIDGVDGRRTEEGERIFLRL